MWCIPCPDMTITGPYQQWKSEPKDYGCISILRLPQLPCQVGACCDVAPLVAPTDLNLDALSSAQVEEIVALQKLVGELCEADALLRRETGLHLVSPCSFLTFLFHQDITVKVQLPQPPKKRRKYRRQKRLLRFATSQQNAS